MQMVALYKDPKGEKVFEKVKQSDVLRPSTNTHSTVESIEPILKIPHSKRKSADWS